METMQAFQHDNKEVKRQAHEFRQERDCLHEEAWADHEESQTNQEWLQG